MTFVEIDDDPAAQPRDDDFAAAALEELCAKLRGKPAPIVAVVAPELRAYGNDVVSGPEFKGVGDRKTRRDQRRNRDDEGRPKPETRRPGGESGIAFEGSEDRKRRRRQIDEYVGLCCT